MIFLLKSFFMLPTEDNAAAVTHVLTIFFSIIKQVHVSHLKFITTL